MVDVSQGVADAESAASGGLASPAVLPTAAPPVAAGLPPAGAAQGGGRVTPDPIAAAGGDEDEDEDGDLDLRTGTVPVFAFPRSIEQGPLLLELRPSCLVQEVLAMVASWLCLPASSLILCLQTGVKLDGRATLGDVGLGTSSQPGLPLLFAIPVLEMDESRDKWQRLGSGAFGTAYATTARLPGPTQVAVKVAKHPSRDLPVDLVKFMDVLAEGFRRGLDDIRPPRSLLAPLGVTTIDHHLHLVTSQMLAMDLCDAIQAGHRARARARTPGPVVSAGAALAVLASQLEVTRWLWQCGFAHSDHKPDNVLLTASSHTPAQPDWARQTQAHQRVLPEGVRAVVCDLGWLRQCRPTSLAGGTRAYRAPEQRNGQLFDPLAADLWGIGQTLHACLTGRLADPAGGAAQALLGCVEALPMEARQLCAEVAPRLLHVDPRQRLAVLWELDNLLSPAFLPA